MAEELAKLVEVLSEDKPTSSASAGDRLSQRLRSDSVKAGLEKLCSILQTAVEPIADDRDELGFQRWDQSQIESILSVVRVLVSSTRSLSVEQVEPIVVVAVQKSMELALSFLGKADVDCDDLSLQNNMVLLIESTILGGMDSEPNVSTSCFLEPLSKLLPTAALEYTDFQLEECLIQGFCCLSGKQSVDRLLMIWGSECLQTHAPTPDSSGHPSQSLEGLGLFYRHYANIHLRCSSRLLLYGKELISFSETFDEKVSGPSFRRRLSSCSKVLVLLRNLARSAPYVELDHTLLESISSFAAAVPGLFRPGFEFVNSQVSFEGGYEGLVLSVLEEFLNLVQLLPFDVRIVQNIRACVMASILRNLDSYVWKYKKSTGSLKPPLVYFPRCVIHVVKLIEDFMKQTSTAHSLRNLSSVYILNNAGVRVSDASCVDSGPSNMVFSDYLSIPLCKNYSLEELLKVIFPSSSQWLDNMMDLLSFLYSEGVKLPSKLERSCSSGAKAVYAPEPESSASHEDEALFGDLFSEGGRLAGSNDGYEPLPVAPNPVSASCNMLIHAATQLLNFLRSCILSPEWSPAICEAACNNLNREHIDLLLHILSHQDSHMDDVDIGTDLHENKVERIGDVCFQLLYGLVASLAFSEGLEDYFVQQILKIEDGRFVYNDRTLALLAHTVISRRGSVGYQLRKRIYMEFMRFVEEKGGSISSSSGSFIELLSSLPSMLHMEILLMAFHFSSHDEKVALADVVFSSLTKLHAYSANLNGTQLSCWAMLVSRLIVLLRHMMFNSYACPTSLLVDFKSKLNRVELAGSCSHDHDSPSLWVSFAAECASDLCIKQEAVGSLLGQLIDFVPVPALVGRRDAANHCMSLSWDVISTTFSQILGLWKGKKVRSAEDLIIERYIFLLCWDVPGNSLTMDPLLPLCAKGQSVDTANMELFLRFSHLFLGHHGVTVEQIDLSAVTVALLQRLNDTLVFENIEEFEWDHMRNGQWLSFVLSLLRVGFWKYCTRNDVLDAELVWTEQSSKDAEFIALGENIVTRMLETGQVPVILEMIASLLVKYTDALQKAFLRTLDGSELYFGASTSLLLLKHTEFGEGDIIENPGNMHLQLESIYKICSRVDELINKRVSGILSSSLLECLLNGFPSHLQTCSGALVSCILNIRGMLRLIDIIFKIKDVVGVGIDLEIQVLHKILSAVMMIKYDRVFESLGNNCESIHNSLCKALGGPDYSVLFLMKQVEGFLGGNGPGKSDCICNLDQLISKAVDIMSSLKKDPSMVDIFKFYIGAGDVSQQAFELYGPQRGDLLVLISSLDNCRSESVNVKALNFITDLLLEDVCPNLKQSVQKRFLDMDPTCFSKWLETRVLGSVNEDSHGQPSTRDPTCLSESTINFILSLVSASDSLSRDLLSHVLNALLILLENAFKLHDIQVLKSYFNFVVQLLRDEGSVEALLQGIVMLMEKLESDEHQLQGLKFLFSFLETMLGGCGLSRKIPPKSQGKSSTGSKAGLASSALPLGSRKNPESLVLTPNEEGRSASFDCDAMSMDEDEDDGTSDGDVGSIDKDEEEEANSERALASKVCTFTSSGSNFMEQHWYFCYTCDLTVSKGCCSVCAKVCHRGHRVVYSRSSRFFCDCGAGGVRGSACQCLKPRKYTASNTNTSAPVKSTGNFQPLLPFAEDRDQLPDSDSDADEDMLTDFDNSVRLSIPVDVQNGIPRLYEELDIEGRVLQICSLLLPSITGRRQHGDLSGEHLTIGGDKVLSYSSDLLQLKKAYKSGSLDLKIKADYPNAKELKSLLASGSLAKSLLSVSSRGRLAVGEGDKVAIVDVGQMIGQANIAPVTADKTNVKPLSKNVVRFEILHLLFNSLVENYLAVAGLEDCQVFTLNPRGEVTDRLPIELALQGAYIRRVDWVPGSQVQLMVVTNKFVKIYDLSQDNICPMHYFTLAGDLIVDATLAVLSQGKVFLFVLSEHGTLYKRELSTEGNDQTKELNEEIVVHGKPTLAKGLSLYHSSTYKLFFVAYQDGTNLIGRLSPDATSLGEVSAICEDDQDGKLRPAALHHWREISSGSGLFVCFSSTKPNAAVVLSMSPHEIVAQSVRHAVGSNSPVVGVTAYKPISKDKFHVLVLHDDGSLQIFSHNRAGVDAVTNAASEKVKKLGSNILCSKAYSSLDPEFPLDFFEKTACITSEVKLSGDVIRNGDSEGAKQSLASEDGYLEGGSHSGFKVNVSNSNPEIVMVGIRMHVGNSSASHIPSEVSVFQRVIKLDEGMRCWYDIPFTVAESLLADEEFTISVGPTFSGSSLPRIDSLEVYGRPKDEFGWKEKMEAVLDLEARVLGCNSLVGGSRKIHSMKSASIQEQVVADGLKLLSVLYLIRRTHGCPKVEDPKLELSKLRCKALLETVFQSDRQPLLQTASCRVLQAVFPKKETYYQVKDSMRLSAVVNSTALLLSSMGSGVSATGSIMEFTAQLHAVTKIALHRQSNLASFLEMNGSQLVDGLVQVLWGILEMESPDTQTMNNIVMSSVELIYCYAECLASSGMDADGHSVSPAVKYLVKLLFYPNEAVQTASSLAISSRLLQVPFPNQTMLFNDDASDNAASTPAQVDISSSTRGNTQVMIEEDSITSSVQYCCDGCSTVPIQRRRWHCTVCPDFDLCEACYEVLDADRLPQPHSREHPMTAIPIEMETIGGDGSDIHFSPNDMNDGNILQAAADASMQVPASSVHVLEPNELEVFSAPTADPVSISASKRAVNSLILSELLEQLKGWMNITSGVRAIPVMQLFYRLSSAVGGPFVDSSKSDSLDLEKLIRWFLGEIEHNRPFVAKTRTYFGEVTILVFMFFTLMLRNWHQPGHDSSASKSGGSADAHARSHSHVSSIAAMSDTSSSGDQEKNDFASQLLRACNALRQQSFVNYLMDILQQLVQIFKSPADNFESVHPGSGCGALLTVRRDLPAGNFSPFFSDSYAKAHRPDLFIDYHRLLLENTFRLVYSLIRPEKHDKTAEKERVFKISSSKDLKLEGYQDVLCSYINNPNTTFVRRCARRLFLHLCGSKSHYYSVRDSWQFSTELKSLHKHVGKSGGLQNPVSYERSVKIFKCLSTMADVAAARPRNWQKYCLRHGDVLPILMKWIFYLGEESVVQALKLLNSAFYTGKEMSHTSQKTEGGDAGSSLSKSAVSSHDLKKKKKGDEGTDSGSEKSCLDMEAAVSVFSERGGEILVQFIDYFLLEWSTSAVRSEAKHVLYGIWHHGKHLFKETMLTALLLKVKSLPSYGQNITEYTELLTWLLGKVPDVSGKQQSAELLDRCLTPEVIQSIYETLHTQNELLANHPNSRIYNTLSSLVEFDGYYLESEPCVACSSPEVSYTRMKLESLKSETKFTDNRIIVKCTGSYTIQSVTMNVHDARKAKSVKVLNLYYNNRPVADLSELKNNWSLWKRAKSCHLAFNQTELKVDFPIPITACNFMIELDSFYENLQASSMEPLQCPRCSRPVTDRHGICSNCHENAYQCRQCRNINYENLDSFLCNECGYSKYGRFEFNFMAKPSFTFDNMENDEDMKRGLAAIETESENAHRRYQQLLGFKKPLLKIVSSIGENEVDSQQKDSVQQMMVSLPGPSCKISRKIALLGVLYGEKCKAAFDSVAKSVQTLQGLRRVLMNYLYQKYSDDTTAPTRFVVSRSPNSCYGCATTFVTQCLEILQVLSRHANCKTQLVTAGVLSELFENNIHQGPRTAHVQARSVLSAFSEGDGSAVLELNNLIQKKVMYCLEHHRSMDISVATREEMLLLSDVCSLTDEFWESRLRVVFQLLFTSIKLGANHPAISEHIILPCLRIVSQACTPPKPDTIDKETVVKSGMVQASRDDSVTGAPNSSGTLVNAIKSTQGSERHWDGSQKSHDIELLSYSEWEKGASYIDFVRRQYKVSQAVKGSGQRSRTQRHDYLALKYALKWKRRASRTAKNDLSSFELGSWVSGLILSACSQSIRSEMCMLINLLCAQSSLRQYRLLNLLMSWLPATLNAAESAVEYFELLFKMIDSEDARLFLTVRGCLTTICKLISQEVSNIESLERSLHIDISQGFILHKLIELLGKFLEVPNIRARFMRDKLLSEVLEAIIVIRGLVVQKTKLISDCNQLLKDLLDSLLQESGENKRQFIRACIAGLQIHADEKKGQTSLFILEQLCNLISPSKPEPVYLLVLNKAHTQEEFIRGSMTKNPYSSAEVGPLMRDVKNKICLQLDLLGLVEDDYGMELLVAGNIISLDLSVAQVYEQVWKKSSQASSTVTNATILSSTASPSVRDCPPMIVTYRLQGLDGEATEPMIKELEEDREELQDPEVEFAIAGAVREYGGLEIILGMIKRLRDDLKSNHEQLIAVLNLLGLCCKIRENRRALLRLGALSLLLETARRAFSVDAMEPAEGILLIVESLTLEANESDNIGISQSGLTVSSEESGAGEQAKKIVVMFLERLSHPSGLKKSNKQQRNTEMVARILPYLTYGEPAAMDALVQHFDPFLRNWGEFDRLQKQHEDNPKDEDIAQQAVKQRFAVENFVRVSESLKTSSCGERMKDIVLEKGITSVAVNYLMDTFAVASHPGYKSTDEWGMGLRLSSVPLILSMLRGLSMGHLNTQRCIDGGGILPLLHALEGVPGENDIGARAENLLDMLSDKDGNGDGFLGDKIRKLRDATRDEMRRRALRKREELLQGLGMRQELSSDGGERIVVSRPKLEGLEDVEEEEDGLACMVCREGYSLRPNDLLGVYSYSKRVNLGVSTSGSARGECVYTTVSHFNLIHFQCHQEAKRADAALKNPKKEWEGAALRNNETLCNALFPVRGPCVPLAQYVRYVDQYWDNLNSLGRADGTRLRLLMYDIVLMLARFATGASFSVDSKGGGKESNAKFLPFMVQMGRHLLDQGSSSQRGTMAKAVSTYLSSSTSPPGGGGVQQSEESVQFMMVNSLLLESYDTWLQHRRSFLQRGIFHAYMQHTHSHTRSSSSSSTSTPSLTTPTTSSSNDLLSIIQPMLVYTGLIEQLQRFFKLPKPASSSSSSAAGTCSVAQDKGGSSASSPSKQPSEGGEQESSSLESWEVAMKDRVLNVSEMVGFSKELLSWLDDMNTAADLQEAFDVIGVLGDVLSGGAATCEEFVEAAINAGKAAA